MDVVHDGREGLHRATEGAYDLVDPRHHAARHERLPGLRRPARRGRRDADPDADRQGRRVRRGRGPRHRRRRLPDQAVLLRRAASPGSGRCCAAAARRGPRRCSSVGDLTVDTAARRVSRGGDEVALTAKEFAVLEHLALRAGEVVSKARHPGTRLGLRLRRRPEHRRGLRQHPAPQARRRGAHPDGARRRLPAGGARREAAFGSVRARATLGATLVVAVALVAAGAAVLLSLRVQPHRPGGHCRPRWPRGTSPPTLARRDAVRPSWSWT